VGEGCNGGFVHGVEWECEVVTDRCAAVENVCRPPQRRLCREHPFMCRRVAVNVRVVQNMAEQRVSRCTNRRNAVQTTAPMEFLWLPTRFALEL
jgi:hypothetical protein